jgi:hypothetical protein
MVLFTVVVASVVSVPAVTSSLLPAMVRLPSAARPPLTSSVAGYSEEPSQVMAPLTVTGPAPVSVPSVRLNGPLIVDADPIERLPLEMLSVSSLLPTVRRRHSGAPGTARWAGL